MSFTDLTETKIPTSVGKIIINIYSLLDEDENITEALVALAAVFDQDGEFLRRHEANHAELVALELITAQELDQLRAFVQTFRARVEALLVSG